MSIVIVGLNHKTASVDVREKLSFPEEALPDALKRLVSYPGVKEGFILSTCNRVEIYASVDDGAQGALQIKKFISDHQCLSFGSLENCLYVHTDAEGVRHAFRVASSLDSMIVGEPQILGQIKDAFEIALKAGTTCTILNKLLAKAISVAKVVRTETGIAESAVSISFAAVELAKKIFGNLNEKTVMLLGAGEMAELAARHLQSNGVKGILVANRSFERAVELAEEFNGSAVHFENFPAEMVMADIVICSTGAPSYVVNRDIAARALRGRRNKPIFMIDISVPRNIDPAVNDLDNVFLYDIDDMQGIVQSNIEARGKEAEKADAIVMREVEKFLQWAPSLDAVPLIVDLREKMDGIRQRELEKALSQLNGLSPEQRQTIEAMTTSIVNKMIHAPIVVLKQAAADRNSSDVLAFARKLFNLDKQLKKHRHEKGFGAADKK